MSTPWIAPVRTLLETAPKMGLTKGGLVAPDARQLLKTAEPRRWFRGGRAPEAAVAGLWLRHNGWEESHNIAQDLPSAEASYWHAILHRMEPDTWNAGYWFKKVGAHAIFKPLALEAAALAKQHAGATFAPPAKWDPDAFTALCDRVRLDAAHPDHALAAAIQEAEWRLLFEHCARANMG